jgi:hypothetical protein
MTEQITKSNLAKLLATENISVEYRKTDTASFDVVNRRLVLPVWNDMTPEMTDLLIGHEVGHALDTPQEYVTAQEGKRGFQTFLNVVEDARIERLIKDRYPGLRRSFSMGYREFVNRDFFKLNNQDVNKLLLIDRINLHFKIGAMYGIKFNAEEQAFVDMVDKTMTFQDVIDVSNKLYEYCKQELEDKRQQAKEEFQKRVDAGEFDDEEFDDEYGESEFGDYDDVDPNSMGSGDPFNDEYDEDAQQENYGGSKQANSNDDESSENGTGSPREGYGNNGSVPEYRDPQELKNYDEIKSVTDQNFEQSLRGSTEQKQIANGKMPSSVNAKELLVHYSEILGKFFDEDFYTEENPYARYNTTMLSEFESKNKNAIAYLVKEFEMKKKAAELARVTIASTGVLDTNKLHTYKFNDDIFRKVGVLPQGKNHGIVMFLDWSGSMTDNMSGTIEQLITLTTFCRKVNVPFEVYAFSDQYHKGMKQGEVFGVRAGELNIDRGFYLLNLFSSTMRNQQYRKMANDLLNFGDCYTINDRRFRTYKYRYVREEMGLGGTPLNSTIIAASKIVNDFRKKNRSEIVDVIFLTDGEDSSRIWTYSPDTWSRGSVPIGESDNRTVSYLDDAETAKSYRVGKQGITPTLLKILKDRTGCNLIGFYILQSKMHHFRSAAHRLGIADVEGSFSKFKKEKHLSIDGYGYDKYFLIPGGNDLSTEDDSLDDMLGENNTAVTTRKLKSAFLAVNKSRLTNRILLSKVVEEIA